MPRPEAMLGALETAPQGRGDGVVGGAIGGGSVGIGKRSAAASSIVKVSDLLAMTSSSSPAEVH